jgi:hypothetical protein
MKYLLRLLLVAFVLQSFQCDNDKQPTVSQEMLLLKKQEILQYINTFSCSNASNCNYIAFGVKPCGGPREYLVFPSTINMTTLQDLVDDYNQLDNMYNIQTGAVSDCLAVGPPSNIGCVNNSCVILN